MGRKGKRKASRPDHETKGKQSRREEEEPELKPGPLWLPKVFTGEDPIYCMSAKQRGDMYHLRAAMQLGGKDYSIVLTDIDPPEEPPKESKTKDLEDYLKRSLAPFKHSFFVPWDIRKISCENFKETDFTNCWVDGFPYNGKDDDKNGGMEMFKPKRFNQSAATGFIANANNGSLPPEIERGMFLLEGKTQEYLGGEFVKLFKDWNIEPDNEKKSTILFVYRDSGSKGGAYPELDTGDGITKVRRIVEQMSPKPNSDHKLEVISCGFEDNKGPGIGEYWKNLSPFVEEARKKEKNVTKRDVEAYFLWWAFASNYFKMAIGTRSGAVDLLTFMDIPTVSIGLRNMVGEDRHVKLAGKRFKRVIAQYDKPRHNTTAYVINKHYKAKFNEPVLLQSPYWKDDVLGSASTDSGTTVLVRREPSRRELKKPENEKFKEEKIAKKPDDFSKFDEYVIEVSVRLACQEYINWPSIQITRDEFPANHVITTRDARYCYVGEKRDEDKDHLIRNLLSKKGIDKSAWQSMHSNLGSSDFSLQLPEGWFERYYWIPYKVDWRYIKKGKLTPEEQIVEKQSGSKNS